MRAELYSLEFPNGKRYIGMSTHGTQRRWKGHCAAARGGLNRPVNEAIRKYGAENVVVRTLVVGTLDYIKELEIKAIAAFQTTDRAHGYNLGLGGETAPTSNPEVAAKVRESMRGNQNCVGFKHTAEIRAKISASRMGNRGPRGYVQSDEHKAKRAEKHRLWLLSPEGQAHLKNRVGRPCSAEKKAKISASLRARAMKKDS